MDINEIMNQHITRSLEPKENKIIRSNIVLEIQLKNLAQIERIWGKDSEAAKRYKNAMEDSLEH